MTSKNHSRIPVSQEGMILITALLFLVVLTVIGVSSITNTVLEEKMASNLADRDMAFQAAESGLRDAGEWLDGVAGYITPSSSGSSGIWQAGTIGSLPGKTDFDWAANGVAYGSQTDNAPSEFSANYQAPSYVVEEMAFVPDDQEPETRAKRIGTYYYSISAIGWGGTSTAQSVLQTSHEKRFN